MSLFAFEEALWGSFAMNISQVLLLLVLLYLHRRGWRRRNGWHPPDDLDRDKDGHVRPLGEPESRDE